MSKIGENLSRSFKICKSPKELDRRSNKKVDKRKTYLNDNCLDFDGERKLHKIPYVKITKFPQSWMAKNLVPTKTPENAKISMEIPKAPTKMHNKTGKKFDAIPKRLQYPEAEDENEESIDYDLRLNSCDNKHRYLTRENVQCETQREAKKKIEMKYCNEKAKSKSKKNNDKENNTNVTKKTQPRQRSSNRKGLSKLATKLGTLKILDRAEAPTENKSLTKQLFTYKSADWRKHFRSLQPRRDVGIWIECCHKKCRKWRYVQNYHDPVEVPKVWYCEMNIDERFASCAAPQQEISPEENEDLIMNAYNAGSIVWGRLNGYPWWPSMVDDCPTFLRFYETHGNSEVPHKYNVIFFNEKIETAWLPLKDIKPYAENPRNSFLKKTKFRRKDYAKQLDVACELADKALPLTINERLNKFSFISRISGDKESQTPKKKRAASNNQTIPIKSRRINANADIIANHGQSSESSFSKASTANDGIEVPVIKQTQSSTSKDKILSHDNIRRQKDWVKIPNPECIIIDEPEEISVDTQTNTELGTSRASIPKTINRKSTNDPLHRDYSFGAKPLSSFERVLMIKILDISAENDKLRERERERESTLANNRDEIPMEIDSDSSNRFDEYSVNSHSVSSFEPTRLKSNFSKESFEMQNHQSSSMNNRNSLIGFRADEFEPHYRRSKNSLRSDNARYPEPPSRFLKQTYFGAENNRNNERMVVTID